MNDTNHLRSTILATRDRLSEAERTVKSDAIRSRLLALEEIASAAAICVYVSFRSEVQTMPIIRALLARGKHVTVPLTRVRERRLDIITITDPERDLVPGYCGIPEPRKALLPQRLVPPAALDQIILPGSVFDQHGGRFGYGGGYYDRLLAQVPTAGRIALAFALQVVEHLPLAEHDEPVDRIVTEDRVISGSRKQSARS